MYEIVGGEASGGDEEAREGGRQVSAGHQVTHGETHSVQCGQV